MNSVNNASRSQSFIADWVDLGPEKNIGDVKRKNTGAIEKVSADNDVQPLEDKLLKHPEVGSTTGSNGVRRLSELHHSKPLAGDMSTPRGARDTLMKFCANFRKKFIGHDGLQGRIEEFKRKIEEMRSNSDGSELMKAKLEQAEIKLKHLCTRVSVLEAHREAILSYFPKQTGERNLAPSEAYKDKKAVAELAEMRVKIRNFRYDFDNACGTAEVSNARYLGEFFSTTRNKFFRFFTRCFSSGDAELRTHDEERALHDAQKVGKSAFHTEAELAQNAYAAVDDLARLLGEGVNEGAMQQGRRAALEEMSAALLKLEEAVRTKNGDAPMSAAGRDQLMATLKEIGTVGKGGHKELALTVTAGGVLPIPLVKLSVGVKYQYYLRISSPGDGSITVERVHSGGLQADLDASVGHAVRFKAGAGATAGTGTSFTFATLDQAVKELSHNGFQGVVNGIWTGGVGLPMAKIPSKWVDRLFGQKNNYNENSFLRYSAKNGYLDKVDAVLRPGVNRRLMAVRKFKRLGGAGKVSARSDLLGLRGDFSLKGHRDAWAEKTEYRSIFTYLRSERKGEAKEIYLRRADAENLPADDTLESEANVRKLLECAPNDSKGRAQLREDIRSELEALVRAQVKLCDDVNDKLAENKDAINHKEYECLAKRFPRATAAAQALFERLAELSDQDEIPEEERLDDEKLARTVEQALTDPSFEIPSDLYEKYFSVTRTHTDGNGHVEGEIRFSLDLGPEIGKTVLTETNLASEDTYRDGSGAEQFGKVMARMGANGALDYGETLAGLKSSVYVNFSHDAPKTNDPRPWANKKTTTVDIKLAKNLPLKVVHQIIVKAIGKTASCKDSGLDPTTLLVTDGVGTLVFDALLRGGYDLYGRDKADEAIRESSVFASSLMDDFTWDWFKDIRLNFVDGSLESIAFGDAEIMRIDVGGNVGHVHLGGGVSYDSLEINREMLVHPSFDTLVGRCDALMKNEIPTAWPMFAARNKQTFAQLFDVLTGKTPLTDKHSKRDDHEFESLLARMRNESEKTEDPEKKKRLENCFASFEDQLNKMRTAEKDCQDEQKARMVADLLAIAARYYDVLDDHVTMANGLEAPPPYT